MKNQINIFLTAITLLFLASCATKETPAVIEVATNNDSELVYDISATQFKSSAMKLGSLETRPFHEVVKANGMFDVPPANQASVSTFFGGTVKSIKLLPGERVKKGQLLLILENPDFVQMQQDYLEAKGQLSYLKSDYERQKNLVQDNVTSQKNFLKAESDYTVTRVKVESLSKKLALMNINSEALTIENIRTTISLTSPINGYITQVSITRGAFLNPSSTAVTIVDTDHLHLELKIFEKDLIKLRIGQSIKFKIQDDKSQQYDASVYLINKTVDIESRTVGLHGHLTDEKLAERFNPGMYVEADIYTNSTDKASLPQEAVVEMEGKSYVLVLDSSSNGDFKFLKKDVKTGTINNGFIEILNTQDFEKNVEFLVTGAFNLITD
jgi:cobalt-zinc-cadmium efflux system membrane fusion protein